MSTTQTGRLFWPSEIRKYILGGNSTFTIVTKERRFTFKVKSATQDRDKYWSTGNQDRSTYFVSVLTGGDNENSYSYLGLLKLNADGYYEFVRTGKSVNHTGGEFFRVQVWRGLEHGRFRSDFEFWHEGVCCVCGRKLTVPESIANGIGPDCIGGY